MGHAIQQKQYRRKINGYNDEAWKEKSPDILLRELLAKFEQNTDCVGFLQQTGNKQIIEASKDKFWGFGMSLYGSKLWDEEDKEWGRHSTDKGTWKLEVSHLSM